MDLDDFGCFCLELLFGKSKVGTLDYLDHLIIPNLWSVVNTTANPQSSVWDTARGLFSRSSISEINYEDVPGVYSALFVGALIANVYKSPSRFERVFNLFFPNEREQLLE